MSDAALYLPLCLVPGISPALVVVVVLLSVMSEMTGVVAVQIGAERRYDGPMGKSDRAFVFGAIALVAGLGFSLAPWVNWLLLVILLLTVVTIINRARRALEAVA
ncbi:inner membrane protein YnbA [bacterium BMS3Abin11]|nr:inner membrane protein YnbA [bacterium BMS3Abin11]